MNLYQFSFFSKDATGKRKYLGSVIVDDFGIGPDMPLTRKAFLHTPPRCSNADIIVKEYLG